MLLATGSSPERVVQPRLLLRKSYQLSNRIHAKGRMHREHNWLARQLDDRSEVLQGIDIQLEGVGGARDVIGRDKQRITVRRTLGRSLDTDVASSTRPVLYKELAAENPRQIFADDAGSCVGRAAGGKGYNHAHRPRRIGLRPSNPRHRRQRGRASGQIQKLSAGSFILRLPLDSHHSITSSARASSPAGISNLRVLAVCTLMINSNLVARSIGRSAGFVPLRIRPA